MARKLLCDTLMKTASKRIIIKTKSARDAFRLNHNASHVKPTATKRGVVIKTKSRDIGIRLNHSPSRVR